jgi:putative heme-binding domain-containing protein
MLAPGEATVRIESSLAVLDSALGDAQPERSHGQVRGSLIQADFKVRSSGEPLFLSFTVETGPTAPVPIVRVSASEGDQASRPFKPIQREHELLPWAPVAAVGSTPGLTAVPDLAGGDLRRGEGLFFGEKARCSQCHAFRGRGGTIGPDLTAIGRKGIDQLYRSIAAPSAEVASDYVPYTVAARDGRVLAGVVRAEGASAIRVTDTNAKVTTLNRDEIDQIRPSGTSIMPVGLAGGLGEANLRDLIAFLMQEPPATDPAR